METPQSLVTAEISLRRVIQLLCGFTLGVVLFGLGGADLWGLSLLLLLVVYRFLYPDGPLWQWFAKIEGKIARLPARSVSAGFAAYFLVLALAWFARHWSFQTHLWDMGAIGQALAHPWGHPPLKCDSCIAGSYLGEHCAFTLYLIAPWITLLQLDTTLLLLKLLCTVGGFWLLVRGAMPAGERMDRQRYVFLAGFIFLAHKATKGFIVWDFREDHLAFIFLCLSLFALMNAELKGRLAFFAMGFLGSLLSKEHLPIILFFLAPVILWDRTMVLSVPQRRMLAGLVAIGSIVYAVLAFGFLIPFFAHGHESTHQIALRLGELGATPGETLHRVLTDPTSWWVLIKKAFGDFEHWKYLFLLLTPFVLPLMKTRNLFWVPAVPGIFINLVSGASTQRSLGFHYDLTILPFLLAGAFVGLRSLTQGVGQKIRPIWIVVLALSASGKWPVYYVTQYWPSYSDLRDAFYLKTLPNEATVWADEDVMAYFTNAQTLRSIDRTLKAERAPALLPENLRIVVDRNLHYNDVKTEALLKNTELKLSESPSHRFWIFER